MTEVLLSETSFRALRELLESDDFAHIRPSRPSEIPFDFTLSAREEGNNIVQSFHERLPSRRSRSNPVLKDIVAFANTNGGTIFIGLDANPSKEISGVSQAKEAADRLRDDVARFISPPPVATIDVHPTGEKEILLITVPQGAEKPYALVNGEIYVRQESDTAVAMRDEIVQMVKASLGIEERITVDDTECPPLGSVELTPSESGLVSDGAADECSVVLPRTGVEIVRSEERDGVTYHAMRDLRNMKVVHNVTRDSARRLWRYAITQKESSPADPTSIDWQGSIGFLRLHKQRGGAVRYDLAFRDNGDIRVFYGVTDEGIDDVWRSALHHWVPPVVKEPVAATAE